MFRKAFSFSGLLLLVGAVVLATPSLGQAQRGGGHGGGGHIGGGHIGGGHIGGGNVGGYRGGIYHGGAHAGGYRGGIYRGGYHYGSPYAHDGYRRSYGSYYPYYGSYGSYYPYSYDTYPYVWPSSTYDMGYSSSYGGVAPSYTDGTTSAVPSAFYPPATQPDNTAHVSVNAPANAEIWFDGTKTTSTGPVRVYQSPPLEPGSKYTYEIRARWNENGQEVDKTQKVNVTAGSQALVSFSVLSKTAGHASSTEER